MQLHFGGRRIWLELHSCIHPSFVASSSRFFAVWKLWDVHVHCRGCRGCTGRDVYIDACLTLGGERAVGGWVVAQTSEGPFSAITKPMCHLGNAERVAAERLAAEGPRHAECHRVIGKGRVASRRVARAARLPALLRGADAAPVPPRAGTSRAGTSVPSRGRPRAADTQ